MLRRWLVLGVVVGTLVGAHASDPGWWSGVIHSGETGTTTNYEPANLGQLKNIADHARAHLDDRLSAIGGAGSAIDTMVDGWSTANDVNYQPVSLGQLKAVADKFYERLDAVGFDYKSQLTANGYPENRWTLTAEGKPRPWNEAATPEENYATANLGQLKILFSFDLSSFTLSPPSQAWIDHFFPNGYTPDGDDDEDGVINWHEWIFGTDPTSSDSDHDGLPDQWELFWGMVATNGDENGNGVPDCFDDFDGDGLSNEEEAAFGTNGNSTDSDGDGMPDDWELAHDFDPMDASDGTEDPDEDTFTNAQEAALQTNPRDFLAADPDRKIKLWSRFYQESYSNGSWSGAWSPWRELTYVGAGTESSTFLVNLASLDTNVRAHGQYYFELLDSGTPLEIQWIEFETNENNEMIELTPKSAELWHTSGIFDVSIPGSSGHANGVMNYEAQETSRESGFDNYERYSPEGATPVLLKQPWLMVPIGSGLSNTFGLVTVWSNNYGSLNMTSTSSTLSISPATVEPLVGAECTLSGSQEGDDAYVCLGDPQTGAKILRAAQLPKITYTVHLYKVTCTYPGSQKPSIAPVNYPSRADIETYLNEIYGKQMNVYFLVSEYVPYSVAFDVGDPQNFPQAAFPAAYGPQGQSENGKLDLTDGGVVLSTEENAILDGHYDSSNQISLFFVGTEGFQHTSLGSVPINGLTRPGLRYSFIIANAYRDPLWILRTVAHEIGHMDIAAQHSGLLHPRDSSGTHPEGFPLKRPSDDRKRLMCSPAPVDFDKGLTNPLQAPGPENSGRLPGLLIYEEWKKFRGE